MNFLNLHTLVRFCTVFSFFLLLSWNPLYADGNCNDCISISKRNWYNSMGQYSPNSNDVCLLLLSDNKLTFEIKVRMMDHHLSLYPDMMVFYNIPLLGFTGTTDAIKSSDLTPNIFENGVSGYEYSLLVQLDLSSFCSPNQIFPLLIENQLVDENGDPYKVESYQILWPEDVFNIPVDGVAELLSDNKTICCYGTLIIPLVDNNPGTGQEVSIAQHADRIGTIGSSFTKNGEQDLNEKLHSPIYPGDTRSITVYPNPFHAEFNIQYQSDGFGQTRITCYDSQGSIIKGFDEINGAKGQYELNISTKDWPPGIYHIKISNANMTHTVKVIKLDN